MDILPTYQNLKCSKHPKKQIIFIQVTQLQGDKNIFYCELCMLYDKKFQVSNCIQTQQIIEHSNHSQIFNWPSVEDEMFQDQINNIQTQDKMSNSLLQQINEYFDELKAEAFLKMESCKKEMIRNASLFILYEDEILTKLYECQMADQFKNILLNNKIEINEKENQCKEFIKKVHSQKHNYEQSLKKMFDNLYIIDFKTPNLMKTSILQIIEKISFIKNENKQVNFVINQTKITNQNQQNIQPEKKIDQNKHIDLLPELFLIQSNKNKLISQNLQITKLQNNSIKIISQPNYWGSYYSNMILDRNKKYVFRLQIKTTKNQGEYFSIGLIRDQIKDVSSNLQDKLSCYFFYFNDKGYFTSYGFDECIKGNLSDTKEIDCMELRVCIESEQLEVVDYPNYYHKYVLSNRYKDNLKTFQNLRFALSLSDEIEITLINAYICEQFQN